MDVPLRPVQEDENFYSKAVQYWSGTPATIEGMLGGFGSISQTDIRDSRLLLRQLFKSKSPPERCYALDCGAGIGRITKHLLTEFFDRVDLVEQNPDFLEQAKQYLGSKLQDRIGNYYSIGLQYFQPEEEKYDVIWIQWVLGHLTESHLVNFLQHCRYVLGEESKVVFIFKPFQERFKSKWGYCGQRKYFFFTRN